MSCSTGPLGAVWAGRVGFLRLGLHCRSLGTEAGEDGLVRPGAALGSLLQLFSCCSPAKAGPLGRGRSVCHLFHALVPPSISGRS